MRGSRVFGALAPAATCWLHIIVLGAGSGCATDPGPQLAEISSASTVGDYDSMGCSTAVVLGLSTQIAEQANCEHPGNFVPFMAGNGITFSSSAVLPYLEQTARDDLQAVAATDALTINSGLRTLAQQYLLVAWHDAGLCGITATAAVGNSNHEGGRAVDLGNYDSVISVMGSHGWAHDVSNDPVHFDHTASVDNRGEDIHAFQTLWNLNNPNDQITADGAYGPQTEARLRMAPATGFAMGATCDTMMPPPGTYALDVVSVSGTDRALPKTEVHYAIVLKNTGSTDWPADTKMRLANGSTSPLHDPMWLADDVVTTIGSAVTAGSKVTVSFDITTPAVDRDTPVSETFTLDDGTTKFGMIDIALTVSPDMNGSPSDDGGDQGNGKVGGGCSTGGGSASLLVAFALTGLVRRRRAA